MFSVILLNCPGPGGSIGTEVECDIVGDTLKDVSTDVKVEIINWDELVKVSKEDIPISSLSFCGNMFNYDDDKIITGFFYGYGGYISTKLNYENKSVLCSINPKSVSGSLYLVSKGPNRAGYTKKSLKINYPQILTLSNNKAKEGDEITVTSTKPFFVEESFTKEKLTKYLESGYYIIWVESDSIKTDDFNKNSEKKPVGKEYYLIDKITPTSITYKIPPYAKTGKVHIINEEGFCSYNYPDDEKYPNSPAYYSTAVDLEIEN